MTIDLDQEESEAVIYSLLTSYANTSDSVYIETANTIAESTDNDLYFKGVNKVYGNVYPIPIIEPDPEIP